MLYRFDGKQPVAGPGTDVSEFARVIGEVVIGKECFIGHGAILRGDYGRIEIGDGTAVEEGAIVHAPPNDTNAIGRRIPGAVGLRAAGLWPVTTKREQGRFRTQSGRSFEFSKAPPMRRCKLLRVLSLLRSEERYSTNTCPR